MEEQEHKVEILLGYYASAIGYNNGDPFDHQTHKGPENVYRYGFALVVDGVDEENTDVAGTANSDNIAIAFATRMNELGLTEYSVVNGMIYDPYGDYTKANPLNDDLMDEFTETLDAKLKE